jgi:hypothetical protein
MGKAEDRFSLDESEIGDLQESQQEKAEEVGEREMDAVIECDVLCEIGPVVFIITEEKVEWLSDLFAE